MACFHPVSAFQSTYKKDNGKAFIWFSIPNHNKYTSIQIPCGQCTGCRLERSRQWAIRCSHEASLHEANAFITLTYDEANLPPDGSLNVRHFQLFIKKLRKKIGFLRYFHCGEYGEQLGRPHYHACLFGKDFDDKIQFKQNKNGDILYTSQLLTETWQMGHCLTGDVTFQSAAYCARYIMKKINGDQSEKHYEKIDPETGEFYQLRPEYTTMSRRPGIGKLWLDQYASDIYPHDFVPMIGSKKKHRTPRYYDNQYEITHPEEFAVIKQKRVDNAKKNEADNTPDRLRVRETVQEAKLNKLPRNL